MRPMLPAARADRRPRGGCWRSWTATGPTPRRSPLGHGEHGDEPRRRLRAWTGRSGALSSPGRPRTVPSRCGPWRTRSWSAAGTGTRGALPTAVGGPEPRDARGPPGARRRRPLVVVTSRACGCPADLPLLDGGSRPCRCCPPGGPRTHLRRRRAWSCCAVGHDDGGPAPQRWRRWPATAPALVLCEGGPGLLGQLHAADLRRRAVLSPSPRTWWAATSVGLLGRAAAHGHPLPAAPGARRTATLLADLPAGGLTRRLPQRGLSGPGRPSAGQSPSAAPGGAPPAAGSRVRSPPGPRSDL